MIIGHIKGATHNVKTPVGRLIGRVDLTPRGPIVTSAWFATPKEIEKITAGAPIYLHCYGGHPGTTISVGEIPRDEDERLPSTPIVPDAGQRLVPPPALAQRALTVRDGILLGFILTAPFWLAVLAGLLGFH